MLALGFASSCTLKRKNDSHTKKSFKTKTKKNSVGGIILDKLFFTTTRQQKPPKKTMGLILHQSNPNPNQAPVPKQQPVN